MSQAAYEALNAGVISGEGTYITGHRNVPQSAQNQTSQGHSNFSDGSGPLFNMYVKMAEEEDNKMADRWQKDADGILIFTGLFSAAVAALVAVSIQDLRPNSQDTSAFYLENIFQLLADPNVSRSSILAIPAKPPPFSPPIYAIWVNSLWFLSLAISLTCALLATLLQQWARRYLTITQPPRYSPHKRARIRAFFADGVEKFHLPWAVATLPTLLHLSLFLFFAGLLIFLVNINHTVFNVVVWWIGLSAGVYGCVTLMPIFRQDSPYYAPLSSSAWFLYTFISYTIFRILSSIRTSLGLYSMSLWRLNKLKDTYRERFLRGIAKTAQETASDLSAEIDGHVLRWTFDALDEDHELEQFFECIPDFCSSYVVDDPKGILAEMDGWTLAMTFGGFLSRAWSSSLLSETVKKRRLMTCVKAADSARLSRATSEILRDIFRSRWGKGGVLQSVEIGHALGNLGNNNNKGSALCAQGTVSGIIANVPVEKRGDRWKALVMDQLGVSEGVLRDYLAHGDSVLFANLIHITRQFFHSHLDGDDVISQALLNILPAIFRFDIQTTPSLPELQHDFCALWNEIVLKARIAGAYTTPVYILNRIRHIYIALHQGTDSAPIAFSASTGDGDPILYRVSSYPLCNIASHASHIHSPPEATAHAPAATLSTVPHPDAVLSTISPSAGPYMSPLPTLTPHYGRMHLADEPSLYNMPQATTTIVSSHLTPPDNLENNQFPAISLESTTAAATRCPADTPTISPTAISEFFLHPAPAASTSIAQLLVTPPSSSTVAEQHNTDLAPGNLLSADPQAASASPRSQIDQLTSGPGFLPLSSVTTFSFTAPQVTSVSDPSTASNDRAFDTRDNSRAPDSSDNIDHHPHLSRH